MSVLAEQVLILYTFVSLHSYRGMCQRRTVVPDAARCACCSLWFLYQRGRWITSLNDAYTCETCFRYVCDACRTFLHVLSPSLYGIEPVNTWGVCCGEDVTDEAARHVYRPHRNLYLAAILLELNEAKTLYCVACLDDISYRQAAGLMASTTEVPSSLTYGAWLAHQYECVHMTWFCPARCGFFGDQSHVKNHVTESRCHSLPLTHVLSRGSLCGELRVLPAAFSRQPFIPASVVAVNHCEEIAAAMPMVTFENRGEGLYMNLATCLPAKHAIMVTARVTTWPYAPNLYRAREIGHYRSMKAAVAKDKMPFHLVVQAHRIYVDGYGAKDYCMSADTTDIESPNACLSLEFLNPGFWADVSESMERPVRSALVQGVIPPRTQVSLIYGDGKHLSLRLQWLKLDDSLCVYLLIRSVKLYFALRRVFCYFL